MQRTSLSWPHYATCLWPGLADLWWRGRLSALPTVLIFALILNGLMIARFIYPEWLGGGLVRIAFWVGLLAWGFWVCRSVRDLPGQLVPRETSEVPDRFLEAHAAFLAGEWKLAEKYLTETLAVEPRDPPALLMLCGVYRQTERLESAEILLEEIEKTEAADSWWLEVAAEK
ncbi:MAG: tetratricopeptide repeat protein, partial [Planctomycetota bacterium]